MENLRQAFVDQYQGWESVIALDMIHGYWDEVRKSLRRGRITSARLAEILDSADAHGVYTRYGRERLATWQ